MQSPEVQKPTGERSVEASTAAGEQLKKLHEQQEKRSEQHETSGESLDSARRDTEAAFSRESSTEHRSGGEPSGASVTHATKRQRKDSYRSTMTQIRSEMSAPARTFSKVIHSPTVEKVSDVVGGSVARPNAVLAGSVAATFLTLFVFLIAKHYGYRLSGFETIGTFAVGWAAGLLYDYARLMAAGRRN